MSEHHYQLVPIGSIASKQQNHQITIQTAYRKGLKHLSKFSHAIIIYQDVMNPNILPIPFSQKVVKLKLVDEVNGFLVVECLDGFADRAVLYDIKPYFPNEDRVKDASIPAIQQHKRVSLQQSELTSLGIIHKVKGSYFLELYADFQQYVELLQGYSHIKVVWWFHKFEKDLYKRTMECDPPYENAPKTGIFASRSPVRPNPFAITTARILELDPELNRIKVSLLDCFDKTPLLGISPYVPAVDAVSDCRLPAWLQHWSPYLDDRDVVAYQLPELSSSPRKLLAGQRTSDTFDTAYFHHDSQQTTAATQGVVIKGAKQHNLKNMDVVIPYNQITVMTGVSGSGKSSLAFDTIYAESQQRFFSNMSLSERSRFSLMEKPDVDYISGLPPAIAISQTTTNRNPRSTVGTATDLYDLLRTLYATLGVRHCPECGRAIVKMSIEEITACLLQLQAGTQFAVQPFGLPASKRELVAMHSDDSKFKAYAQELEHIVRTSIEQGIGAIQVQRDEAEPLLFQTTEKCYDCDHILFEMTASDFSFNNPESMCPACNGLGMVTDIDVSTIIKDPTKSILDGASEFWGSLRKFQKSPNANWMKGEVLGLANELGVDLDKPWQELPEQFKTQVIYGTGKKEVSFSYQNKNGRTGTITRPVEGVYPILKRLLKSITSESQYSLAEQFMTTQVCDCCHGERLKMESRIVTIADTRFPEVVGMSIENLINWVKHLPGQLSPLEQKLAQPLLQELYAKLSDYRKIGLDYLTLDRSVPTLSGGEFQRLQLVSQLNSGLSNILYILDEPTTGLHPKDYEKLMEIICQLKAQNNTVIMVEHTPSMMLHADHILDIGPGAGIHGGYLIAQGTPQQIMANDKSSTGQYLSGNKQLTLGEKRAMKQYDQWISLYGVEANNLQSIDIRFPLHAITCITGVSGSGKSSLVKYGILPAIRSSIDQIHPSLKHYQDVVGAENIHSITHVTQKPIGRSSRSTPATYTGMMDELRLLFAQTQQAKTLHYPQSKFSYNTKEGQCSACHGLGYQTLDTAFISSAKIECPLCKGQKFHASTLQVLYQGKHIAQVLDMSVKEALLFFEDHKKLKSMLQMLDDIGLGYLTLGQSSQTLSGGEAQRIKLATELASSNHQHTLYLLDEPTTGLHFDDIQNLLHIFSSMTAMGHSVLLVEHNLDVIKHADWIIDLGPGGGIHGGALMAQGLPADIMSCHESHTGRLLKGVVEQREETKR